ncbi:FAD:protein FMN transferase [Arenimonas terrae]|uniref:FAD:protein FMN transferase n=1 Tax=Arenimonas terrae TaxID=2546226 RepID=A0A5C4RR78_9GAMM|nr:FAD:protein FMN transferase [Arenimonas terrae]TNJ33803.1 FAD:protein FMN transferase [Arenimonas terrae]
MPPAASTSEPLRNRLRRPALLVLLLAAACSRGPEPRLETLHVFGTATEVELRGAEPERAQAAIAEISAQLNQRHSEWHAWEPSELTRINAAFAAGESAHAPASVIDLVRRSKPLSDASEGLFDPAIGGLIRDWGFHTSQYPVQTPQPRADALARWRQERPRIGDVSIAGDRLSSRNPRVQLDFGAVAEGVAGELILDTLRRHGIEHALVSLGGDVVALGDGDGRPWTVAIRDPFGGVLGGVELGDGEALFSTGNYNKFRASPSGARWGHILDPRTGYPARGAAAVVVLHPDPVVADASATALFVAGPAGFERIARRMGLGCALMVTEENEMLVTAAMKARLQLLRDPVPLGDALDLGADCGARNQ